MIVRPASTVPSVSQQNHRKSSIAEALRWFWRFSQFYGEYAVRSPQEKQTWLSEQRIEQQHRR